MTEQEKAVKFIFQIPKGEEKRWKLYREVLQEFNQEVTTRVWGLISDDIDSLIKIMEVYQQSKSKRSEENE